jgi:hypothetical protein
MHTRAELFYHKPVSHTLYTNSLVLDTDSNFQVPLNRTETRKTAITKETDLDMRMRNIIMYA